MLVSELREVIKKYNEDELRIIITELYKGIPRKIKDEKDFDSIINDLEAFKRSGKSTNKEKVIDFQILKSEIVSFCDLALDRLYYIPNQIVHKTERSKWRFKVKRFIKDLNTFKLTNDEADEIARLYELLYYVLSKACGIYLFSSTDPFITIGISQPDFLEMVLSRKFFNGITDELIKSSIELVIDSYMDSETIPFNLISIFVNNIKTNDGVNIALNQCKIIKDEILYKSYKDKKKKSLDYHTEEKINRLTEIVFRLYVRLKEYDNAILYFKNNSIENDNEIILYVLLELLYLYDLKDLWLREYEIALKEKIKPRESLVKIYNYIKDNGTFPDGYYVHH